MPYMPPECGRLSAAPIWWTQAPRTTTFMRAGTANIYQSPHLKIDSEPTCTQDWAWTLRWSPATVRSTETRRRRCLPPHLRRRPGRNGARFSRERTLVSLQFSRWLKRRTIRIFRQEAPWWRWTELCNRRRPRDFREHRPKSRLLRTPRRNPPMKSCPRGALALQRSKRCELRIQFRRESPATRRCSTPPARSRDQWYGPITDSKII